MAWIDPVAGSTYVDLSFALAGLVNVQPAASSVHADPEAPIHAAGCCHHAARGHTQTASWCTLADLCINKPTSRKNLVAGVHHSASLAGLMNSRAIDFISDHRQA